MQIKVSFAISSGTAESDALPLLTLEIDAQPSIETLGLGQDLPMEVFTDGDIQLRQWQLSTLPRARHILDWHHLRRRVTKLNAVVHGRPPVQSALIR